jgi:hypothetical protein
LRSLGDDHLDNVGDVVGLEHAVFVLAGMRAELCVYGSGTDDANADVVLAEFFGDRIAETVESPFGGGINGSVREWVFAGDGGDVDDVAGLALDHHGSEGADGIEHGAQVSVEDGVPVFGFELVQRSVERAYTGVIN